jgi:hypothetical protein
MAVDIRAKGYRREFHGLGRKLTEYMAAVAAVAMKILPSTRKRY